MKEKNLKNTKQKKDNQQQITLQIPKGITLAALVITIIILLILAGVAISMITGGDGLFGKANSAGHKYNEAAQNEADTLAALLSSEYLNNGENTNLTQEEINALVLELVKEVETLKNSGGSNILAAYPVGAIYISTSDTNPGEFLGGTWVAYAQGRTLLGVGTGEDTRGEQLQFAVNQTGGEYNHLLTTTEMPSHNHGLDAIIATNITQATYFYNSAYSSVCLDTASTSGSLVDGWAPYYVRDVVVATDSASNFSTSTGGSTAHNNIQPYIACYIWQRTA